MLDINGDGAIEPQEVLSVFEGDSLFDMDTAKQILSEMDLNNDGKITFCDF